MKENEIDAEEKYRMIVTCLRAASDAGTWAFWRERFKCNHPQHPTDEINNPTQFAHANFHAAKGLYCHNKEDMDRQHAICESMVDDPGRISPSVNDIELFNAMKRVVEEEMATQLEEQILNAEGPQGYWEGDEYLPVPESNDMEFDLNSY